MNIDKQREQGKLSFKYFLWLLQARHQPSVVFGILHQNDALDYVLLLSFYFSWVSGVGSVYHPQVWTACVSYTKSSSLSDRVFGDDGGSFLLLVYVQGTTQPSYWQCSTKTGRDGLMGPRNIPFEIASGDTSIQVYIIL